MVGSTPHHRLRRCRTWLAVISVLALAPGGASGQTPATPPVTGKLYTAVPERPAAQCRFVSLLTELAQKHNLCIVCEGQPLRLELNEKEDAKLREALAQAGGGLQPTLEAIAGAFDYDAAPVAVRNGAASPNVFLLRKRYSDPDDVPLVTFDEARLSLTNVVKAVGPFQTADVFDALNMLYKALTPVQRQQAASEGGCIASSLAPEQRRLVGQLAYSVGFNTLHSVKLLQARLSSCVDLQTRFGSRQLYGDTVICYTGPLFPKGQTGEVLLSRLMYTDSFGVESYGGLGEFSVTVKDGKLISSIPDPTIPDFSTPAAPPPPALASPLSRFAERLNARLGRMKRGPDEVKKVVVDPALARKPVLAIGPEENAAPEALIEAAAQVYGLRVAHPEVGTARIGLQVATELDDCRKLKPEILRLLPRPISQIAANQSAKPMAYYNVAMRRLRTIIEPELAKREADPDETKRVFRFQDAPEEAKDLAAITSLLTGVGSIRAVREQPPLWLTDVANTFIRISVSPSSKTAGWLDVRYGIGSNVEGGGGFGGTRLAKPE